MSSGEGGAIGGMRQKNSNGIHSARVSRRQKAGRQASGLEEEGDRRVHACGVLFALLERRRRGTGRYTGARCGKAAVAGRRESRECCQACHTRQRR